MTTRREFIKILIGMASTSYLTSCASQKPLDLTGPQIFNNQGNEKITSVKFSYLNKAACFGVSCIDERKKETKILLDPSNFGLLSKIDEYTPADLIAVSHGHGDHINEIANLIRGNKTKVICPSKAKEVILLELKEKEAKERVFSCSPGYTTFVSSGIELQMLPSSHVHYDLSLSMKTICRAFWNKGQLDRDWPTLRRLIDTLSEDKTYSPVLTFNNKSNLFFMGSAGTDHLDAWKKMKNENALPKPDVLLLPYSGLKDNDMKRNARKILDLLEPKKVILHHCLDYIPPHIKPFIDAIKPYSFAQELQREGIEAVVAEPGQEFYLKL